jgi:hypothetical protein
VLINGVKSQQESATTMYSGGGFGGWGYGGWGGGLQPATTSTSTWNVGTLIVDIFDVQSKQLLFRGQGQATISDNAEKNTKNVYKALAKMFKDFPPAASK